MAKKRIINDIKEIRKEISGENSIIKNIILSENIYKCQIVLKGPEKTLYENGLFLLDVSFPEDYPFSPPKIYFNTPMLHPNVAGNGRICIDILQNKWSSVYTLLSTLMSISSLLNDPNTDEPLNVEISDIYIRDRKEYAKKIIEFVEKNKYKEEKKN